MKIRLRSTTGRLGRRPAWQVLLVTGFPLSLWLLLPASASALITTGDGGWSWQNPLPQGDSLEAVATIDAQHAVAVGDCGAIITTADGGATWTSHDSGLTGAHLNDVSFPDANNGWAVAWTQASNGGSYGPFILHSADGGLSWTVQASLPFAKAVEFIDARHGWVCGNNTVWSTSDGGLTWKAHNVPFNWYLSDVVFTDVHHGWVVGHRENIMGEYYYPIILATSDGGVTWKKQYFPGGNTVSLVLASVAFPDASHGWAVDNSGNILATSDGGAHWTAQSSGTTDNLRSVTFADASHGWIVAVAYDPKTDQSTSGLLATTDGGATWTRQAVGIQVNTLSFADRLHGYAVGADGSIATTIDGGASWQVRSSVSPASGIPALWDIAFADTAHGWAVGGGMDTGTGVILATTDGGATWSAQAAGSGLLGVSFPDAVHGWAVGGGSHLGGTGPAVGGPPVILHTGDGGLTWQTQSAGTSFGSLNDVDFVDANHGCVAGSSGAFPSGHPILAATSDGGVTWQSVTLPQAAGSAWAVSFVDAQHGWAVTSLTSTYPSVIYATSDGGLTWTSQYVASGVVLRSIAFADAAHGWAVGQAADLQGDCAVLSTTNGGATWSEQDLASQSPGGLSVSFIDASHGWIACGSAVLATVDGGGHWWAERTGAEVRSLAFTDPNHGWAAAQTADWIWGDGGILSTTTGGFVQGPVTSVSGGDGSWHDRAVRLVFSATDEPGGPGIVGGQAKTQYRLDDGPWTAGTALTVPAPANHSNDGVHRITYFSTDAAGTAEVTKSLTVQIDTTGPTTAARKLSGHKRGMLQLSYRVSDRLSYLTGSQRVVLRTAAGRLVHIFKTAVRPTGIWNYLNWVPRAAGTYRYWVYATDLAGNKQRNVASATVLVR